MLRLKARKGDRAQSLAFVPLLCQLLVARVVVIRVLLTCAIEVVLSLGLLSLTALRVLSNLLIFISAQTVRSAREKVLRSRMMCLDHFARLRWVITLRQHIHWFALFLSLLHHVILMLSLLADFLERLERF